MATASGKSQGHGHTVLIVDDSDDIREALVLALEQDGIGVASAWGAEDGLRQLREGLRPCAIVLDLMMPGMNGYGFLARLGEDRDLDCIPVLIVTADHRQRAQGLQVGAAEFFPKPVDFDALVAAIERHCGRARQS